MLRNENSAHGRVKESSFTRPWAGEGILLHPDRTPCRYRHYRHSGGDAAARTFCRARTRQNQQLFEQS